MDDNIALKVEGVSKEYRIGILGHGGMRGGTPQFGSKREHSEAPSQHYDNGQINDRGMFMALSDISFDVKIGETLGIIGHNGAGKSTLLKLITQITWPTTGRICLNGRVASLLEVGTGFHPDFTGRENIYINGAMLGMGKQEIDRKLDAIVDFSECEQFIDTPLKHYSSGMKLKLGFSVAAHLDAEIVIIDEVLSVGDAAFRRKCAEKMKEIQSSGRTILCVSHHMDIIRNLCSRCLMLDHGKLVFNGGVDEAIRRYLQMDSVPLQDLSQMPRFGPVLGQAHMEHVELMEKKNSVAMGKSIRLLLRWTARKTFRHLFLRVGVWTVAGTAAAVAFADLPGDRAGVHESEICLDTSHLLPGKYTLELILAEMEPPEMEPSGMDPFRIEPSRKRTMMKQDAVRNAVEFKISKPKDRYIYTALHKDWGYTELSMTVTSDAFLTQQDTVRGG